MHEFLDSPLLVLSSLFAVTIGVYALMFYGFGWINARILKESNQNYWKPAWSIKYSPSDLLIMKRMDKAMFEIGYLVSDHKNQVVASVTCKYKCRYFITIGSQDYRIHSNDGIGLRQSELRFGGTEFVQDGELIASATLGEINKTLRHNQPWVFSLPDGRKLEFRTPFWETWRNSFDQAIYCEQKEVGRIAIVSSLRGYSLALLTDPRQNFSLPLKTYILTLKF